MENASKALLIAGAILLCILIIAIGMFIYNSAQSTVTSSMTSLSTQQIESFNNQFTIYEGLQNGSHIKSLMGILIGNANTYRDEPNKIPAVYLDKVTVSENEFRHAPVPEAGSPGEYIKILGQVKNRLEPKHEYYVEISYQSNGLVDYITISYNPNSLENPYYRESGIQAPS